MTLAGNVKSLRPSHRLTFLFCPGSLRANFQNFHVRVQVRIDLAFQSTDPFADGFIEAPDDAHAAPPTGWRRHDTNFQLLMYFDPIKPANGSQVQYA